MPMPATKPRSRFQQLLQQLSDCHEEELSRAANARVSHHSTGVQSMRLLNSIETKEDSLGFKAQMWDPPRIREPREQSPGLRSITLDEAVDVTTLVPLPSPSEASPMKLHGDIAGSPGRGDDESELDDEDPHVSPIRKLAAPDGKVGAERFPLRRLWASESKVQGVVRQTRRQTSKSKVVDDDQNDNVSTVRSELERSGILANPFSWKSWMSYPSSLHRLCWDMVGGILIMYDLFAVPLQAFSPPQSTGLLIMDWITLIFWTVNVGMSLTTGYVEEGITIMEPRRVVLRYLRTWFVVDMVVLVPDWVFTIVASGADSSVADFSKMPRVVRLARVVRLLRLVRLKRLFEQIEDVLDSEYYSVMFNIFKMMLLLFTVNHVIACGWYALGDANRDTPGITTWIKTAELDNISWEHSYLVSLHWSLTQFTPAGNDVTPTNEVERGFTIGVVVFALVGFAYVVGSITASLAQLRTMSEEASKDFWQMRRFLNQNSVDHNLAARIQRFVEYAYTRQQKTMSINQVKVLALLSKQLMEELQCAINLPHMKVHPLFMFLNEFSFITMNRCAKESISHMEMAQGDTLFLPEQHANCMYFVSFGRLEYIRLLDNSGTEFKEFVDKGEDWLAEPALWTEAWYHVGEAKAYTDCEVLLVNPKAFEEILNVVRPVASIVAVYCRSFMTWLQAIEAQEGMLTDVIQGDQVSDTIRSFLPMWMVEKSEDGPTLQKQLSMPRSSTWNLTARIYRSING